MATVRYEVADGVATITLDRPESLNSMTGELMSDLHASLNRVRDDTAIRCVVLTGTGRGFCSGADLSDVAAGEDGADAVAPPDDPTAGMEDTFNPAMRALADCPVPTIGRINGVAAGGGFGLAMTCDVSIAARSAFFVATFGPKLGIVPDLGTTWHLPMRVGPARARGIAMLGGRITADQAAEWGLIWEAVDDDQLDARVADAAELFSRTSPDAMNRIRTSLADAERNTLSEQLDLEMEHQAVLIPKNMVAGAQAFMEKRDPTFDGDRRT